MSSNTFYFNLDSTFRNRTLNPLPSQFSVNIATASTSNVLYDPICRSSPVIAWTASRFSANAISDNFSSVIVPSKSSETTVFVQDPLNQLQQAADYYAGAVIEFATHVHRRVKSYRYVAPGLGKFELSAPVDNFSNGFTVVVNDPSNFTNAAAGCELFVPGGSSIDNFYTGMYLCNENLSDFRIISRYMANTRTIEVSTPINTWGLFNNFSIRWAIPALVSPVGVGSTTSQIVVVNGAQIEAVIFQSCFIREQQFIYGNEADTNGTSRVIAWDPSTLTATVSPPFNTPVVNAVEILPITSDNYNSFVNIQSMDQVSAAFKFQLVSLHIPRQPISSSIGGFIENYPYVTVLLSNVSTSMTKFSLVSNNPNSASVQFRATLTPSTESPYFYKLNGDATIQSLQINPKDNITVGVYLPDGAPLVFQQNDTAGPQAPNALLQISLFFAFVSPAAESRAKSSMLSEFF